MSAGVLTGSTLLMVEFDAPFDPPLVRKFGVFNSGLTDWQHYERDAQWLGLAKVDSLRVDLSIGKSDSGFNQEPIVGTAGNLGYDWEEIDSMTRATNEAGVLPYWGFCYMPKPLQGKEGWRSPPIDLAAWGQAARDWARHFKENNLRIGYHEVWNEPDFPVFFSGTREEYFEMYRYASLGFRAGDPDAVVGGPALAYDMSWVEPFLGFVHGNDLPLDFFSYHAIGPAAGGRALQRLAANRLGVIRGAMDDKGGFSSTQIHLSEYFPFTIQDWAPTVPTHRVELGPQILDDFMFFLNHTDLTRFHFAKAMDISDNLELELGLISASGEVKKAWYAFYFYGDLPIRRSRVTVPEPLQAFAGAERGRAGVLIWNNSKDRQQATLSLQGTPYGRTKIRAYQVDETTRPKAVSRNGSPSVVPQETVVEELSGSLTRVVTLEPYGMYYLALEPDMEVAPPSPIGEIIRQHYYYESRGGGHYAEFDHREWRAYLGMGDQVSALAQTGVELTDLEPFVARFEFDGPRLPGETSVLALRLDYRVEGEYRHSMLIHDGLGGWAEALTSPWGTGREPDAVRQVATLGYLPIDPAIEAPSGWDGRLLVSFILRDTGPQTRARVGLSLR